VDHHLVRDYELLDAGDGRRLERFGDRAIDRPAPRATEPRHRPEDWAAADLRFEPGLGWTGTAETWTVSLEGLTFELRPTESGQVGVFPEQADNWPWLRAQIEPGDRVLNLFAYTGGSTVAAATAGAEVAHVDAARSSVVWARRNAELSGIGDRPIRWLVDDAEAYVRREGRRGRRYDGIVLDPPSYGHGGGSSWRLADRMSGLLEACRVVAKEDAFVLLTAHSEGIDADWLGDQLRETFGGAERIEAVELELVARSGARLWLGSCARMIGGS
jgi:23S rRNA (cytosine1962-C5)-methyltransferase